jgi:hypothetical protein
MTLVRNLDLMLLALAVPVFIVADWPLVGWLTGAVVWALWRGIGEWSDRRAEAATDPRRTVGIAAGSMIGRGWLLGLILLAVGLAGGKDVGLSAALLVLLLFTVHFTLKLILRTADPRRPHTT